MSGKRRHKLTERNVLGMERGTAPKNRTVGEQLGLSKVQPLWYGVLGQLREMKVNDPPQFGE